MLKGSIDGIRKAAMGVLFTEFSLWWIGRTFSHFQRIGFRYNPHAVRLQVPEWIFGMMALSRWTELDQKSLHVFLDVREQQPSVPLHQLPHRIESEQWFVRSPLISAFPDRKVIEPGPNLVKR